MRYIYHSFLVSWHKWNIEILSLKQYKSTAVLLEEWIFVNEVVCSCEWADPHVHHSCLIGCNRFNVNVTAFHIILPIKIRTTIREHWCNKCYECKQSECQMSFFMATQVSPCYETFRKVHRGLSKSHSPFLHFTHKPRNARSRSILTEFKKGTRNLNYEWCFF